MISDQAFAAMNINVGCQGQMLILRQDTLQKEDASLSLLVTLEWLHAGQA